MALELDRRDRRILGFAAGIFGLLVLAAFILAPDTASKSQMPTTYSTASGGAKAAFLLLQETGYRVERWERSPAELPDGAGRVLILADPMPLSRGDRDRLRAFAESGGRIIATGLMASALLPDETPIPDLFGQPIWTEVPAVALSSITRAAPRITLAPVFYWEPAASFVPLYADAGHARILQHDAGRGQIIMWASPTPLTNAGLAQAGNLEFFLACVGPREHVRVLWDEYFHGYRQSLAVSSARSPLGWLLLQLGVLALAVLVTYSRRSGPIFVPAVESRLSPLEFVRTLGHLYDRAGAASVAVDVAHSRFRYWLTRRLGAPGDAPIEVIESALRDRWRFEDRDFRATLAACESARHQIDLKPKEALRLVRALCRYGAKLKLFGR